jgi:hypothetical protein
MSQVGLVYVMATREVRRVIVPDQSFEYHKLWPGESMLTISLEQFKAVGNSVSKAMAAYSK